MPANLNSITLFLIPERVTRAQFFASLSSFTLGNWYPDPSLTYPWVSGPVHPAFDPMDAGINLDLQQLYISVINMGGYDYVESTQRWVIVALSLGLWQDEFHSPREYYRRYLLHYEIYARRVRRLFTARKRIDRDPNEYSQQAFTSSQEPNDREDYHVACRHWSSLDIRMDMKKQGVLDATMIMSGYFTISPAVQLYVMQKTYLQATDVFENYTRVGMVQFPPPKSVGPLSSVSRDEAQCVGDLDSDKHLSEEARRCKQTLINRNRKYIFETHIKKKPLPLPVVTSEELSRFVYDEVDSDTDDEGYDDDEDNIFNDDLDPSQVQLVEKFGFNFNPQKGRPRPKPKDRNKPAKAENIVNNGNGITLAEYLDRNPIAPPANSPAWQTELLLKFGVKPKVYGPEPSTEVVAEGPNFEEYMHMHGYRYDSPGLKHFFDTRIKLEGGFWQIELDRLEALERRIRGDDERGALAMCTHTTHWDLASAGSRTTPVERNSNETADTSTESEEPETFQPVAPPPGFAQMPMSMHEYGRRVANCDERQEVMHWGETPREPKKEEEPKQRPANPRHNPANYFEPPISPPFKFKPPSVPPFKKERPEQLGPSHPGGEYVRLREEYNQHRRAVDNLLGSDTYDTPIYAETNTLPASEVDQQVEQNNAALGSGAYDQYISADGYRVINGSRDRLLDRSNNPSHRTLNPPTGQRVDITNFNPFNPPSYNYAQQWLQQCATVEDDEDDKDRFEMQQMNEPEPYEDSPRSKRIIYKSDRFDYQGITNEYNSYKAPSTPKLSHATPARSPGALATLNAQGSRMAYTPSTVNQLQHTETGSSNKMEDRQLKLTASEDLLLSTTFKAYEVQDFNNENWRDYQ